MHDYTPPTPAELAALTAALGLSRQQVGLLVGSSGDPRRTAGKWLTGQRAMPFASLYTLASRAAGVQITPRGWRAELAEFLSADALTG